MASPRDGGPAIVGDMTDASRWTQIEEIFHEALELPENEREAWLDARCAGDAELRAEVASLIASDREARFESVRSLWESLRQLLEGAR